ncbi:MerR family transcriptional regulator [Pleomorphomonas sp. PLEO]|uniref:MerR family transcriptional regulator n=1 Tax=Pleomorphomonas sp. PLEO TaxID=3239306 RepID=UPI00351F29E0
MEKATDAFRTISEVAEELDLPQHVLRFWETKFSQIRPMKRGGGRRYYRPDDVELLRGIQYLLYGEGYTIKGVQRILKEQGARFVMEVWRHPGEPIPVVPNAGLNEEDDSDTVDSGSEADEFEAEIAPEPIRSSPRTEPRVEPSPVRAPEVEEEPLPAGILPESVSRSGFRFMERFRGPSEHAPAQSGSGGLSREDIRRLQSTLFELLECKRLLDQTR